MAFTWIVTVALLAGAASADLITLEANPSVVQVESLATSGLAVWSQTCVASILVSTAVLSAASCFSGPDYQPTLRRIRAGSSYRSTGGSITYILTQIHSPQWENSAHNDITVVRLLNPLIYSNVIAQATISAPGSIIPEGLPVVQLGWGVSDILSDTTVITADLNQCVQKEEESEEESEESDEETSEESEGEDSEEDEGESEGDGDGEGEVEGEGEGNGEGEEDGEVEGEGEGNGGVEEDEEAEGNGEEDVEGKILRSKRYASTNSLLCGVYPGGVENDNADVGGPWLFGNITLGVISGFNSLDDTSTGIKSTSVADHTDWIISVAI